MTPSSATARQAGFFGLFGLIATGVHIAVFSFIASLGGAGAWANLCGFLVAVPVSYFGNAKVTFGKNPSLRMLVKFIVIALVGFALNHLNVTIIAALELPWPWSLPGMVVVVPGFSFLLNKLWVYR